MQFSCSVRIAKGMMMMMMMMMIMMMMMMMMMMMTTGGGGDLGRETRQNLCTLTDGRM